MFRVRVDLLMLREGVKLGMIASVHQARSKVFSGQIRFEISLDILYMDIQHIQGMVHLFLWGFKLRCALD